MPTIPAVHTVNATPSVEAIMPDGGPTYDDIRRSLGDFVFSVYKFYLSAENNLTQIEQGYSFTRYDINGAITNIALNPLIDPMQRQTTLYFRMENMPLIINGRNNLNFNLLPHTELKFFIYSLQDSVGQFYLKNGDPVLKTDNFKTFETATGKFDFFGSFKPRIEWKEPN